VVFSASAEAEADDAHEGPTAGTTIGIIQADGTLGFSDFVDNDSVKIEGVDAVLKDGKIELLLTAAPERRRPPGGGLERRSQGPIRP